MQCDECVLAPNGRREYVREVEDVSVASAVRMVEGLQRERAAVKGQTASVSFLFFVAAPFGVPFLASDEQSIFGVLFLAHGQRQHKFLS